MKNLYALPAALMLLLVSCKSDKKEDAEVAIDPKKTDIYADKLNGKVKTVAERSFTFTNGAKGAAAGEPGHFDTDLQYDATGMLTIEKKYNAAGIANENTYKGRSNHIKETQYINGAAGMVTEHSYDKSGNVTSITRRTASNSQIDRIEMKYKGKSIVEKNTFNNQNTPIDKITYTCDKEGNIVEENIYMGTQSVKVRAVYEYDGKGHKTGETRYSGEKLSYKTSYTYDGDKLMNKITTGPNGDTEYAEVFKYDDKGNIIKFETFEKATNTRSEEVNVYDGKGNILNVTISNNGKMQFREMHTYDKNNNIISIMATDATGKILNNRNYAYTYDSNNNWTKKVVNIMGEPAFIIERAITYHP
ncbi:hypothetical protein AM493_00625 [Flavobacterium akiainvivens]|uniref:Sugar-binding protein n=1 Tax=Flavobacterium akiainvivens TaxID=1202724 RepID=A0A0M8MAN3_9FLAO|nr:hypothetical protein [Flavobacterium akiainvivens]KOS04714.1 hypothetical protein AM493_00625 [Flavobacterium akiainvivens]SFQ67157.1 YD repeat-containing protein [Flavobacterium akiainvivens]